MSDAPIVFVVDEDPSTRWSTERVLHPVGFDVAAFASVRDFLQASRPDRPGCLVLDVPPAGRSGLDLQRELVAAGVTIPIVLVAGQGDVPATTAMKAGAVELLTKPYRRNHLLDAIRTAIGRDTIARRERRATADLRARYASLTAAEREVMARIVAGMRNAQIAFELATTERSVERQRALIMDKMRAGSLAELVGMVGRLGAS